VKNLKIIQHWWVNEADGHSHKWGLNVKVKGKNGARTTCNLPLSSDRWIISDISAHKFYTSFIFVYWGIDLVANREACWRFMECTKSGWARRGGKYTNSGELCLPLCDDYRSERLKIALERIFKKMDAGKEEGDENRRKLL
jgi:hypothetical protein